MKRLMRVASALAVVATGFGSVGCLNSGSRPSLQDRYASKVDPCWPDRYAYQARQETLNPFATQVSNGNIVDHTIPNYMFEAGTEKLTPAGMQKLDYIARRRPAPDSIVYLQTSRDVPYDSAGAEKVVANRQELDAKRKATIERYLVASTQGRVTGTQVSVVDSPDMTFSVQGPANAMRIWPTLYTARMMMTGVGAGGNVQGAGGGAGGNMNQAMPVAPSPNSPGTGSGGGGGGNINPTR